MKLEIGRRYFIDIKYKNSRPKSYIYIGRIGLGFINQQRKPTMIYNCFIESKDYKFGWKVEKYDYRYNVLKITDGQIKNNYYKVIKL